MRKVLLVLIAGAPLALLGCGPDEKTYVVPSASSPSPGTVVVPQAQPPATVVTPPASTTRVCPAGQTVC